MRYSDDLQLLSNDDLNEIQFRSSLCALNGFAKRSTPIKSWFLIGEVHFFAIEGAGEERVARER